MCHNRKNKNCDWKKRILKFTILQTYLKNVKKKFLIDGRLLPKTTRRTHHLDIIGTEVTILVLFSGRYPNQHDLFNILVYFTLYIQHVDHYYNKSPFVVRKAASFKSEHWAALCYVFAKALHFEGNGLKRCNVKVVGSCKEFLLIKMQNANSFAAQSTG